MKTLFALIGSLMLASAVYAQQPPLPPDGPPGGGPPGERPEGRNRGPGRPDGPGRDGPDGRWGPPGMGGGGMGGGAMDPRMQRLEMARGYLDMVDRYTRVAHDPTSAGIAAVLSSSDILKARGTDAVIDYFNKLLPDVKNPAVARAIRIHMVDIYKQAGKQDTALEQLKQLITAEPGKEDVSKQQ